MSQNIGIIGTGYVGLVTGNCFASTGNKVWCIDIDQKKIKQLKSGKCTIFEPGLEKLLHSNIKNGNITFSTEATDCVNNCNIIFLCLPTPPNEDGSADLHYVLQMADTLGKLIKKSGSKDKKIIINKSTVPVGTAEKTTDILAKHLKRDHFTVVSNPEFLREGAAVDDAMRPDRVVIGTTDQHAIDTLKDLYAPYVRNGNPIFFMDEKSAEVTKYAANAFLATKISFMNQMAEYCDAVGADITNVRRGIGSDNRIGKAFLYAGIGYGGSCFPKDVKALLHSAVEENELEFSLLQATEDVNSVQYLVFMQKLTRKYGSTNELDRKSFKKLHFAMWGLAFKPNTDDIREAPALRIIEFIKDEGGTITAFDEEAMANVKAQIGNEIKYADNMYDALEGADALVICTEWNAFRTPDFAKIKAKLKHPVIFDGRNLFDLDEMEKLGFEYYSMGRRNINCPFVFKEKYY